MVTDYKRITIRRGDEEIQTDIYILTLNKFKVLKEIKIGYSLEKVEYINAFLRKFKCRKYGLYKKTHRRHPTCKNCGPKEKDYIVFIVTQMTLVTASSLLESDIQ